MKIHTFGDSHSVNGWSYIKNYLSDNLILNSIGPKLCYSFGRDGLNLLNIKNYNVENNDIVIFVLVKLIYVVIFKNI